VSAIVRLGGSVCYDYEYESAENESLSGIPIRSNQPPGPGWLRDSLGENFFCEVVTVAFVGVRGDDAGLVNLKALNQLQEIFLWDTQVTDSGLEHLKGLTQLQRLYFRGKQVTDAGLGYFKGLTRLKTLYFQGTQITDAGLKHLKRLTQLGYLNLENTKVTNAGVKDLQKALPNCKIIN
jgi:hypothetical protein